MRRTRHSSSCPNTCWTSAAAADETEEEPVEHRPGRTGLERGANLTEDLTLSGNHRVESGGNPEQVQRCGLVGKPVDDRAQLILRQSAHARDRLEGAALGVVADEIELGAVAGREADGLAVCRQRPGELRRLRQGHERTLAQGDGSGLVGESDEGEVHRLTRSG
jgi:hypothetical protein